METKRYELKYVFSTRELETVLLWLKLHPMGVGQEYPNRTIANVYFDSYDYQALEATEEGRPVKKKIRYRWYNTLEEHQSGHLEIKHKHHQVGWKTVYPNLDMPSLTETTWTEFIRQLKAQLPPSAQFWLNFHPQAVLINQYFRNYFTTADRVIRITIDSQLTYYLQHHSPTPNLSHKQSAGDLCILEIKCPVDAGDQIAVFSETLPLRRQGFSKYASLLKTFSL